MEFALAIPFAWDALSALSIIWFIFSLPLNYIAQMALSQ